MEELAQLIKKTGFFGFQNEYSQDNLMDGVARILTVTIDKKTKTVRCYEKSPPGFIKIEETLEDIFKEAQ